MQTTQPTTQPTTEPHSDGYVVLRKSTLAWLLERYRVGEDVDVPAEVAIDIGDAVVGVSAPIPEEDRLRTLGPMLSLDHHIDLLEADEDLELPSDRQGSRFWKTVAMVTHTILTNEGRAALQVLGGKR